MFRRRRPRRALLSDGWTCHFCNERRPDEKIAVMSIERELGARITMTENKRYCNDRLKCYQDARDWANVNGRQFRPVGS